MTNWYHLPDKDILSLIMIISRSNVEVRMTAGKIIDMSLFTFANVCLILLILTKDSLKKIFIKSFVITDSKNSFCIFKYVVPDDNVSCSCIQSMLS